MTYDATLVTRNRGLSIWLYEIEYNGVTYRYTSAAKDLTELSNTWLGRRGISHSGFRISSAMARQEMNLNFPRSHPLAQLMLVDDITDTSVTIRHGFEKDTDNEFVVKFRGRIVAIKSGITRVTAVCETDLTKTRIKGLPSVIQRPCRHGIYTPNCGVDIASHQTAGTITNLTGDVATISAASGESDGFYSGGVLTWSGIEQMIALHAGSSITLIGPIVGLAAAQASSNQSVSIAPGCPLTRDICNGRFSNLPNFGGWSWIDESPFDGRVLY